METKKLNTFLKLGKNTGEGRSIAFSGKFHVSFIVVIYLYIAIGNEHLGEILNPILLVIGALFPDADHRYAPAGRIFPLWLVCKHRGFTHSWEGLILFSGLVAVFSYMWALSFACGYYSHLLLDSLTPSGVKWFYFKRKRPTRTIRNG